MLRGRVSCIGSVRVKRVIKGLEEGESGIEKSIKVRFLMGFGQVGEVVGEEKRCNDEMGLAGLPSQDHEVLLRSC